MFEIFSYTFMQKALLGGLIVGFAAPLIGVFVVLRKMSLIGDSLSHVALSGVVLSIIAGVNPIIGAIVFSLSAALGIQKLRERYKEYEELSLAVIMSAGIALAVVLVGVSKNTSINFMTFLFGSISMITYREIVYMLCLTILIVIFIRKNMSSLFSISFDEESAKVSGIDVNKINIIFMMILALTIVVSMRIVGVLLISSLMTIPVACAMQLSKDFKSTIIIAIMVGELSVILGIIFSFYFDVASGGTIVLTSIAFLISSFFISKKRS